MLIKIKCSCYCLPFRSLLQMDYENTYRAFVSLLLASRLTTFHSNFFDSNFIQQKLQLHANVSQLPVLLQQQQARLGVFEREK